MFPLSEGENPVTVQATDVADNSSQVTRTVTYFEPTVSFSPTPLSFLRIPGFARGIAVQGDYAFIAGGPDGLYVVYVSDRNAPNIVASLDTPGNAVDVKVRGGRAYVADRSEGLHIIDISNPINPLLISSLDTSGFANALAVSGNRVLIGDPVSGLQIIDVTDSAHPFLLGEVEVPGKTNGLDVSGYVVVLATGVDGLNTIDVSNPSSPSIIGGIDTPGEARRVVIDGHVAYVADRDDGLQVVDISDPTHPIVIGSSSISVGGDLLDIVHSGGTVFGAINNSFNVVPMFDISDPSNPTDVDDVDFSSFPADRGIRIDADSRYVYMTARQGEGSYLLIGQYISALDGSGFAPNVQITDPFYGDSFMEGDYLSILVDGVDDKHVVAVTLWINGQPVLTDSTPPYRFDITVPDHVDFLNLTASAFDLGGNVGYSSDVTIIVSPDPRTTVVGTVFGADGLPISGGTLRTMRGLSATTASDGTFSITGVPTIGGDIRVDGMFTDLDGTVYSGSSDTVSPVPGGTTDVGQIVLRDCVLTPAGLVSWWPGEGDSSDIVGSNPGSLQGGTTFISGKVGQAFRFDGVDDYVSISDSPALKPSGPFSVELWFKQNTNSLCDGTRNNFVPLGKITLASSGYMIYEECTGNNWNFFVYGLSPHNVSFNSPNEPGVWKHFVGVYEGTKLMTYVDGVLTNQVSVTGTVLHSSRNLQFGKYSTSNNFFDGLVDEAAIYNRALTAQEVLDIYNAGSAGKCKL